MFALEINFKENNTKRELIYVKRPYAIVGGNEGAHVYIDDLVSLGYQLAIARSVGRKFRVKPIGIEQAPELTELLKGDFDGQASFDLGPVKLVVNALDLDLLLRNNEPPDRAGVRVLRQASASAAPIFPALVVPEPEQLVISFAPEQPLYVGRGKACQLRLDVAAISNMHARIGFESGQFWVEDLGSTNGTFVKQQQISGRVSVPPGEVITLARDIRLIGVVNEGQLRRHSSTVYQQGDLRPEQRYPALVSLSESARPARIVIPAGGVVNIGRDPGGEMWLGAPHVSRQHCAVSRSKTGAVSITDRSTNGTSYDLGVLQNGDTIDVKDQPQVLDFGGGITVAICFNEFHEQTFINAGGRPDAFRRRSFHAAMNMDAVRCSHALSEALAGDKSKFSTFAPVQGGGARLLEMFRALPATGKFVFVVVCCLGLFLIFLLLLLMLGRFSLG